MARPIQISPSVLAADPARMGEEVAALDAAGADIVHWDVMDGVFVPNITFGPHVVKACRPFTDRPFEAHLMVQDACAYADRWVEAGCSRLIVHPEAEVHLHRTLGHVRSLGASAAVVLNPATPAGAIAHVLDMIDLVLVMTVNPGFGGQSYLPSMEPKIAEIRRMIDEAGFADRIDLEVDGGVSADTIGAAARAGANVFVAGSAVFGHPDGPAAAISELRDLATAAARLARPESRSAGGNRGVVSHRRAMLPDTDRGQQGVVVDAVEGARSFGVAGEAYDAFMGRYSRSLAPLFADAAGVRPGDTALDVGCGPGALTAVLVERLGVDAVAACDPAPGFVAECARRHPGVRVEQGRAESIPFDTGSFDHALAQLVVHFVSDPQGAACEMVRVVRRGGSVGACVWDFADGMELLRCFWDAASELDPSAPDEARTLRFGGPGEIADLFESVGILDVAETTLTVTSDYTGFDELWSSLLAGVGPAGAHCLSLDEGDRARLRAALFARLGEPAGAFTLRAVARGAVGRTPD